MSVRPRLRASRSNRTSDGTVPVQLEQVNTQKLSRTTRPRSDSTVRGRSALSQLVFFQAGAGLRPRSSEGRAGLARPTAAQRVRPAAGAGESGMIRCVMRVELLPRPSGSPGSPQAPPQYRYGRLRALAPERPAS